MTDSVDYTAGGVRELSAAVRGKQIRAVDVVDLTLERIALRNPALNAFVHVDPDAAMHAARELDMQIATGVDPGPLAGVPFGVKDLEDCQGMPTCMGSALHRGVSKAAVDSTSVARLRRSGAIPVGKTAVSEFGFESFTSTRAFGTTRNPWNLSRTPGASSGGSAAAVAGGLVSFATSADGAGSTRAPAAFCGLVGMKPTHGLIGMERASDTVARGAVTTTVADQCLVLEQMSGTSQTDRTSLLAPIPNLGHAFELPIRAGIRIAFSADLSFAAVDAEVVDVALDAARQLAVAAEMVWTDITVSMPNPAQTWRLIACFELHAEFSMLGIWPQRRDELDPITVRMLELGQQLSPADYGRVHADRAFIEAEIARLFQNIAILATPSTACAAFAAAGPTPTEIGGADASQSRAEPFGAMANMAWIPALSVPAGTSRSGLPIGLQLCASRGEDATLLALGHLLERIRPWPQRAPWVAKHDVSLNLPVSFHEQDRGH